MTKFMKRFALAQLLLWPGVSFAQTPVMLGTGTINAQTGGYNWQLIGPTNPLPTTPATGVISTVKIDQTTPGTTNAVGINPNASSGSANAFSSSGSLAANQVVKASAGNLYSFQVAADSTLSGTAWWVMIYDATSAPIDGAVTPAKCYAMPSGATTFSAAFPTPVRFGTGIVIGVSTTGCFTKTASTHAFISGDAQ